MLITIDKFEMMSLLGALNALAYKFIRFNPLATYRAIYPYLQSSVHISPELKAMPPQYASITSNFIRH